VTDWTKDAHEEIHRDCQESPQPTTETRAVSRNKNEYTDRELRPGCGSIPGGEMKDEQKQSFRNKSYRSGEIKSEKPKSQ
jgi:hypothetical protein